MISDTDTDKPVIVLGAGGHAKVIIESLRLSGRQILGLTDPASKVDAEFFGVRLLGGDDAILKFTNDEVLLVNGVGSLPGSNIRRDLTLQMKRRGYRFAPVIHPSAVVASDVILDEGAQVMAGAVIQSGARIGLSCIVNTGAIIDHDCIVHDHCHIAPGVTLSGNVVVGEQTHIGTGSSVVHGILIGRKCVIAAGSTVYEDLTDNIRYVRRQAVTESIEGT